MNSMKAILSAVLLTVAVGCEQASEPAPQQRDSAFLVGPSGETEWEVTLETPSGTLCKGWIALALIDPYNCGSVGQAGHWNCNGDTLNVSGYLAGHSLGGIETMSLTIGGAPVYTMSGSFADTTIRGVVPELGATFRADRR